MDTNFKYLTNNPEDLRWGLYLTVSGSARILPDADYPPAGHPIGYNFNWQKGRILHEYQVNYITEGGGIMETNNGTYKINEGSIILLRPNLWHRYRPLKQLGWIEHYVGIRGEFADKIFNNSEYLRESPVIQIGFHESILNNYQDIFNHVKNERPGYQQICSGLVIHILGQIISIKKNENFEHSHIEKIIQKACLIIRDNPYNNMKIEKIANNLNTDYSLFRKSFKKYTGLSPKQYHTSLRIKQAINLLMGTEIGIKEISSNLGFCSVYYFTKLFKEKTGRTPSTYRNRLRDKG
jgi:AraC-like DNA-binding protein